MEEYKKYSIGLIFGSTTIEEVEERIKDSMFVTTNRNSEGKIHSYYIDGKYEPAIIIYEDNYSSEYYLYDGDIKDSVYPFCITYCDDEIKSIKYYSSERIKNGKPVYIDNNNSLYNLYDADGDNKILSEYESKYVRKRNNLEKELEKLNDIAEAPFKFAD